MFNCTEKKNAWRMFEVVIKSIIAKRKQKQKRRKERREKPCSNFNSGNTIYFLNIVWIPKVTNFILNISNLIQLILILILRTFVVIWLYDNKVSSLLSSYIKYQIPIKTFQLILNHQNLKEPGKKLYLQDCLLHLMNTR